MKTFRIIVLALLIPTGLAAQDRCDIASATGSAQPFWVEVDGVKTTAHNNMANALEAAQEQAETTGLQ